MPERPPSRRALAVTGVLLMAASVALGGAAMAGWARVDFQVPLRGIVAVPLDGSAVLPALGPLALLALAAVAAVLAIPGWARWLVGALLVAAAVPPVIAVLRVADGDWLTGAAMSAVELPVRSVPVGTATVLFAGPALAAGGAALLTAAGVVLGVRGHRMPRLGRRYQSPTARSTGYAQGHPDGGLWERLDVGEDPTA
ncbi:MAG: Trp biosynthesis-associated membrane protein [Actinomycetota bacterium]|nr:Trp biosynthesis-associated membrane protein [Actinomycetota bacterium]